MPTSGGAGFVRLLLVVLVVQRNSHDGTSSWLIKILVGRTADTIVISGPHVALECCGAWGTRRAGPTEEGGAEFWDGERGTKGTQGVE